MPKCIQCNKRRASMPKAHPLFCSRKCIDNRICETHMDWKPCKKCGEWMHGQFDCTNPRCPSYRESYEVRISD